MDVARYIKNEKDVIEDVILSSGIHVKPKYGPEDLEAVGFDYEKDLGEPGEFPFTRNLFAEGYRTREWTTRQYTGLRHTPGDQRALPSHDRPRPDRPQRGLRPAHADGS